MATVMPRFGEPAIFTAAPRISTKPGFFARFVAALMASREAEARRHIARHQRLIDEVSSLSTAKPPVARGDLPF